MDLLEKLSKLIDDTPPIPQPQRFGNKAFKTWLTQVKEVKILKPLFLLDSIILGFWITIIIFLNKRSKELVADCLRGDESHAEYIEELAVYLSDSFGNDTRIDYGTGHEMTFAMFLMALFKCGALKPDDSRTVAVKVFNEYLRIARKLQLTYKMEPAGSHGVWSLDDFQFLPFIFGSAQLLSIEIIK